MNQRIEKPIAQLIEHFSMSVAFVFSILQLTLQIGDILLQFRITPLGDLIALPASQDISLLRCQLSFPLVLQFSDTSAVDQAFGQNAPNLLFCFIIGRLTTKTRSESIPDRVRVVVAP